MNSFWKRLFRVNSNPIHVRFGRIFPFVDKRHFYSYWKIWNTSHRSFSLCAAKRINRTYTTNCQESSKPNLISIAFECVISFAGGGFTWGSVAWLFVAVKFYREKINYRSRRYKDHEFHWLPFLFVSAWHAFENLSLCECWQITALTNSFHPHIHSKTYKQKIALLHCLHESLAYDQQL